MENQNTQKINMQKAALSKEDIQKVNGSTGDTGIDQVLGPSGKAQIRADVYMYKFGMRLNKEKAVQRISEKYSWNEEIQTAAVRYAASIYDELE